MTEFAPLKALGLMSGTSMDGVDGAVLETDGVEIFSFGESAFRPFSKKETEAISAAQGLWAERDPENLAAAKTVIENAHIEMIGEFEDTDLVGFHGQTLAHDPDNCRTHQLGDGALLANRTGRPVVWDFRSEDLRQGGQGAPLAPVFHFACARYLELKQPVAFLNLGGVGNVTLVDPTKELPETEGALTAFDTGPANAPVNDLMMARFGLPMDEGAELAQSGQVQETIIRRVFQRKFFSRRPPKSLDRNDFADSLNLVEELNDADAAATLTALPAACVAESQRYLGTAPELWMVCGGGRLNPVMMRELSERLDGKVLPVEDLGLDGDMLEAQAFAYLAARVLRGLPTSFPMTTGVQEPVCGGKRSLP